MRNCTKWTASLGLLAGLMVSCASPQTADLVLKNGRIITLDRARPEATVVAVRDDRIAEVGEWPDVQEMIGPSTRVIDLKGKLVVPGLTDAHAHLLGIGLAKAKLDLVGTESETRIAAMVRDQAGRTEGGRWIAGRGWDQNDWKEKCFPSHSSLTKAAPGNPVCLTRIDGHAVWVNKRAMEIAGLDASTPDPPGGRIIRDKKGRPTGVLVDNAVGLVTSRIPQPGRREKKKALLEAIRECNTLGFTSFHDAGSGREAISLYRELLAEGKLTLRLHVMIDGDNDDLVDEWFGRGPSIGEGNGFLTIRSVKLYADGALGSRGAALLEDYCDDPGNRGIAIEKEESIFDVACRAIDAGFQVCTHAIGDGANRTVLDAYERAFRVKNVSGKDRRFRIEHAQILDHTDIPRFGLLGVIASMQAQHCTSDMPWVQDRIGRRRAREGAYVWRKLLDSNAILCNGSDAPVESMNPYLGVYAAVTRKDHTGAPAGGWFPGQAMTRLEALESFTKAAAYASFDEMNRGCLKKGFLADMTVLSNDIMTVPEKKIPLTEAGLTIVAGRIVWGDTIRGNP